jgi:hypothetical protein
MLMEELELMQEQVNRNLELTRLAMDNICMLDQSCRYGHFECRLDLVYLYCIWTVRAPQSWAFMDVGLGCVQPARIS